MILLKTALLAIVGGLLLLGCAANQHTDSASLAHDSHNAQCTDVLEAASLMAHDLLTDPSLNQPTAQWTLAIGPFDDQTAGNSFDINDDIFLQRLRTELSEAAQGQIALIQTNDNFRPSPALTPNYMMEGKAMDLPNPIPNCYLLQFTIFTFQTHQPIWSGQYKVKVAE